MIGRLLNLAWSGLLYFSLGTLIAEGIIGGYVWTKWELSGEKIARVVAVARGFEPGQQEGPTEPLAEEPAAEQVSYEQVLQARAIKDKNLQLREQALVSALGQLRAEQQKLADEQKRYKLDRAEYETKLACAAKTAQSTGQEEARRILQAVKPKQAKEILLGMLDNKEQEAVVGLLSGMTDSKRAKILAEFKTAEETKKIDEVLQLIRKGVPEGPLAQQALGKLGPGP